MAAWIICRRKGERHALFLLSEVGGEKKQILIITTGYDRSRPGKEERRSNELFCCCRGARPKKKDREISRLLCLIMQILLVQSTRLVEIWLIANSRVVESHSVKLEGQIIGKFDSSDHSDYWTLTVPVVCKKLSVCSRIRKRVRLQNGGSSFPRKLHLPAGADDGGQEELVQLPPGNPGRGRLLLPRLLPLRRLLHRHLPGWPPALVPANLPALPAPGQGHVHDRLRLHGGGHRRQQIQRHLQPNAVQVRRSSILSTRQNLSILAYLSRKENQFFPMKQNNL